MITRALKAGEVIYISKLEPTWSDEEMFDVRAWKTLWEDDQWELVSIVSVWGDDWGFRRYLSNN